MESPVGARSSRSVLLAVRSSLILTISPFSHQISQRSKETIVSVAPVKDTKEAGGGRVRYSPTSFPRVHAYTALVPSLPLSDLEEKWTYTAGI